MVRLPMGAKKFSLPSSVMTGAEAHPVSYSLGDGDNAAEGVNLSAYRHLVPR